MKVQLISITQVDSQRQQLGHTSPEQLIIYCARVSNPAGQSNTETAPKLLRYLIKHKHWSPFDMVDMTVEIETSRAISAQIIRHWSFDFQEFSQRYAELPGFEFYTARRADSKNRQNSTDDLPEETQKWWIETQTEVQMFTKACYEAALARDIAKESARFLLPISAKTRLYMKGSVRSWMFYLQTRLAPSTQKEHREIAQEIELLFKENFPITWEAMFGDYNV